MENLALNLLSHSARTATTNSDNQVNYQSKGVHVIINVTVAPTSGSITPSIQGLSNGVAYDLLVGSPILNTGVNVLKLHPSISPVGSVSARDFLPVNWRVTITHSTANSFTYSVSANLGG